MDKSTPVKAVGACSRVTVTTEPGASWFGERREKNSSSIRRLSGVGMVLCRYSMRPLPTLARGGGERDGGGGMRAVLEKGYAAAFAQKMAEENRRAVVRERENIVNDHRQWTID